VSAAVRIGISTCPNDTYAFAGLLLGAITPPAVDLVDLVFELSDIQELNEGLRTGRFDVAKASFAAVLDQACTVLPVGSALGFGVGPVLLAPRPTTLEELYAAARSGTRPRVLAPGRDTTAALLFEIFHPDLGPPEHAVFSDVMPALENGRADLGVCIHEGRFTWRERGLALVEDLGQRWETATGLPLPLGGLCARGDLEPRVLAAVVRAVAASLDWAGENRAAVLALMRQHAQEHSDDVLWAHVDLYVNDHTRDLGSTGRRALDELAHRAAATGRTVADGALAIFQDGGA